jgi:hypothetical protein
VGNYAYFETVSWTAATLKLKPSFRNTARRSWKEALACLGGGWHRKWDRGKELTALLDLLLT